MKQEERERERSTESQTETKIKKERERDDERERNHEPRITSCGRKERKTERSMRNKKMFSSLSVLWKKRRESLMDMLLCSLFCYPSLHCLEGGVSFFL